MSSENLIKTRDGKEVEKSAAWALNSERLWFVSRLLRDRLGFDGDVDEALKSETDPTKVATLKTLRTAEALLATLREKGPAAYAFAAADSEVAEKYNGVLAHPDWSTPPKHWGTYEVAELFVPFTAAEEKWVGQKAAREARNAERERERAAAKAEKEQKEREAAAERERQAAVKSDAADALFADADPAVVSAKAEDRKEQEAEEAKVKAIRDEREAKGKEYFRKAFRGELVARGYKNTRATPARWYVALEDRDVLCMHSIIQLFATGEPAETPVRSTVDGSMFAGKLSDCHTQRGSDKEIPNWMCAQFKVKLQTADGRPVKETAVGYIIMDSREGGTMRDVARELGILRDDQDSEKSFWQTYRLQPLQKAANYLAEMVGRRKDERNGKVAPAPEPEPQNGDGKDKPRRRNGGKRNEKSDEPEGEKHLGKPRPEAPEMDGNTETDDTSNSNDAEQTTSEMSPTADVPLTHSPFAAQLAAIAKPDGEDEKLMEFTPPADKVAQAMEALHGKKTPPAEKPAEDSTMELSAPASETVAPATE